MEIFELGSKLRFENKGMDFFSKGKSLHLVWRQKIVMFTKTSHMVFCHMNMYHREIYLRFCAEKYINIIYVYVHNTHMLSLDPFRTIT